MAEIKQKNLDEWKNTLRSAFILAITGDSSEKAKAFIDIGGYYLCYAPTSLYKYYSDDPMHFEAVKNNQMWYSAPCNFNDVFDCTLTIEEKKILDSAVHLASDKMEIRAGSQAWRQIDRIVKQQVRQVKSDFEDLRTHMGIACLSERDNSLLMWAHYAKNHRGICVEYDLHEFNTKLQFSPVPIVYDDKRVCIHTLEALENDIQGLFIKSLTSKSHEWSYEREWRIIRDEAACGEKWDSKNKGALLNAPCPKSITMGCMVTSDYAQDIRRYCEENSINLYQMEKSKDSYRLEKVTVLHFDD